MTNKNYSDYIVFLLGGDTFGEITEEIDKIKYEYGMDSAFEDCVYIAQKFNEYDTNWNYSEYESLVFFLEEYKHDIIRYLRDNIEFTIIK